MIFITIISIIKFFIKNMQIKKILKLKIFFNKKIKKLILKKLTNNYFKIKIKQ